MPSSENSNKSEQVIYKIEHIYVENP